MIKRRLRFGLAMVILTTIVMGGGAVVFSLLLGRNVGDMLFGDSFLIFELLIVLAVLFVVAFFLCPKDSTNENKR
jgi:hypothetical protein